MSRTRVVNIRKETCDVYIGRARHGNDGYFGNPFRLEAAMTRGGTLGHYREYFYHRLNTDKEFLRRVNELPHKQHLVSTGMKNRKRHPELAI